MACGLKQKLTSTTVHEPRPQEIRGDNHCSLPRPSGKKRLMKRIVRHDSWSRKRQINQSFVIIGVFERASLWQADC